MDEDFEKKRSSLLRILEWKKTSNSLSVVIENRLYISGCLAAADWGKLEKYQLTHIVNVFDVKQPHADRGIHYLNQPFPDSAEVNLGPALIKVLPFVEQALSSSTNSRVLIHCAKGQSRSAALILAVLLRHVPNLTFAQGLCYLQRCRPVVMLNHGFHTQLQQFANDKFSDKTTVSFSPDSKLPDSGSSMHGNDQHMHKLRSSHDELNQLGWPGVDLHLKLKLFAIHVEVGTDLDHSDDTPE